MKSTLFMVNTLEDVVDMVVHCGNSVELFFCSGRGEFVVIVEVNSTWIKAIEISVGGEFVGRGGSGVVGKFRKR